VADRALVRLAPEAARAALAARAGAALPAGGRLDRLGVGPLDRAAGELGLRFEPEFRGEPVAQDPAGFASFYVVHLPEGLDLAATLERLRGLEGVRSAEPIAILPVSAVPNDSLWSESWWYAQATGHDVHADEAWDVTTGDTSIVVGILDTGVIPYHPDLGGRVAGRSGQIWTNRVEKAGVAGVDDDGNGYVDDVHGWDFVALGATPADSLPEEDYLDEDPDPNDYAGHGTMVAGLVGALTDNTIGVAGMAWQVRLMPLRIGWAETTGPLGYVDMTFVARAIRYATRNGAGVLNLSFQSLAQSDLTAALDDAIRSGVVVVSASGNNDQPCDIAQRPDVIAVGATDAADVVPYFSTRGDWVDLSAPGVSIASTFRQRISLPDDSLGYRQPGYGALSGTSFSSPLVSGAVALVAAIGRASCRERV
jgi:subtilisin family serine protease